MTTGLPAVLKIFGPDVNATVRRRHGALGKRPEDNRNVRDASTSASILSVLILALAIALVLSGLPTTIAATNGRRISTIGHVLVVASKATRSDFFSRRCENRSSASRSQSARPRNNTFPWSSRIQTSMNRLWTSSPTYRIINVSAISRCGRAVLAWRAMGRSATTSPSSKLSRVGRGVAS